MDFVGGGGFSFNFLPEAEEAHPPQISKQSSGGAGDAQSIEPDQQRRSATDATQEKGRHILW